MMLRLIFFICFVSNCLVIQAFNHQVGKCNSIHVPLLLSQHSTNVVTKCSHQLSPPRRRLFHWLSRQQQRQIYSSAANDGTTATTKNLSASSSSSSLSQGTFDGTAVLKYGIAITVQMVLIGSLFRSMDLLVSYAKIQKVPFLFNCVLFYGFALKSRLFNPMSNTRPQVKTLEAPTTENGTTTTAKANEDNVNEKAKDIATIFKRKMPTWTPPGIVFPIVWLLIIGPIRAITSSMIYASMTGTNGVVTATATAGYASVPILSYIFHLCIGDVWNTINNVERRFGVAVTGVLCVWLSKAHAVYQYYRINPTAGTILGLTLIWLTIASALVTATWRLNPDIETGRVEPLYPIVGKGPTKFAWFSQK